MSASSSDQQSQPDAAQLHPEFGYFAPTMRFRRKLMLTLKGAFLGALAGAVSMFFMTSDREEKALTMLAAPVLMAPAAPPPAASTPPAPAPAIATPATPAQATPAQAPSQPTRRAAGDRIAPPVRFVPESIALPTVVTQDLGLRGSAPVVAAAPSEPSTVGAAAEASALAAASEAPAPAAKAVARPKKKIVREHERAPRHMSHEPEPRSAYAGPLRPPMPIFGFGW